jgi:hypothetical protein
MVKVLAEAALWAQTIILRAYLPLPRDGDGPGASYPHHTTSPIERRQPRSLMAALDHVLHPPSYGVYTTVTKSWRTQTDSTSVQTPQCTTHDCFLAISCTCAYSIYMMNKTGASVRTSTLASHRHAAALACPHACTYFTWVLALLRVCTRTVSRVAPSDLRLHGFPRLPLAPPPHPRTCRRASYC